MSRVLIVGLGSIGNRRARMLAEMGHCVFTCDPAVGAAQFDDLSFALDVLKSEYGGLQAALVCTPAAAHYEVARQCVEAGIPSFIEKPLCATWEDLSRFGDLARYCAAIADPPAIGVACNMRYAYDVESAGYPFATLWSEKPLWDWRPGAMKAYGENGIILESAVHELDVACSLFGPIRSAEVVGSADNVTICVRHECGESAIICNWSDYADTRRYLMLQGHAERPPRYVEPDLSDDMYRREMADFLAGRFVNPLATALRVTDVAIRLQEEVSRESA